MEIRRKYHILFLTGFLVCALSWFNVLGASIPRLISAERISLPSQPKQIEGMAVGQDGRLYLLDREDAKIFVYSPRLEALGVLGTPERGPAKLTRPFGMSICNSRLAVAEHGRILIFSIGSSLEAKLEGIAERLDLYSPSCGFQLLPSRLLFTALGFEQPPPRLVPGASTNFMTLFSTDAKGSNLRVERRETISYNFLGSWQAFAVPGLSAPWNGAWVVARQMPLRLFKVDSEGRVAQESPWQQGELPEAPVEEIEKEGGCAQVILERSVPYAEALIPFKDVLGVVLWDPSGKNGQHKLLWIDSNLSRLGEEALALPVVLGTRDILYSTAVLKDSRVLFLVVHRAAMGLGTSELFIAKVGQAR